MRFGLKGKMLLVILSLLLVSYGAVALLGYIQIQSNTTKELNAQLITKTDYMREKITSFFSQRETVLRNETRNSSAILEGAQNPYGARDELRIYFMSLIGDLKKEYGIIDIYVGYADGSIDCGSGWVPEDPNWKANERPWYVKAVESVGQLVYTDIYIDSDTQKPVVTLSQAIPSNSTGEYAVVAVDVGLAQLSELFNLEKIGESGYPFLLDGSGRFIIHPVYTYNEDVAQADTLFTISNGSLKDTAKQLLSESSQMTRGNYQGVTKIYHSQRIEKIGLYLVATLTEEDFTKDLQNLMAMVAIIMVGSILFFTLFIVLFINRITRIIGTISDGMKQIAKGNLGYKLMRINRNDELGALSSSMDTMQQSMKDIIGAIKEETDQVNKALSQSNQSIEELTREISETSETVEYLSVTMEETASSTEEMNATSMEIERAVETIAEKAQEGAVSASEISKKALDLKNGSMAHQTEADKTRTTISGAMDEALVQVKAVERVQTLSDAILQIASQTNLLALNAAIESARAGEAGKGFSVVADEIRKLAEDSKNTVNEIRSTVAEVSSAVNNLVDISKETLLYIETKVVDSYKESVAVGDNYDKDAGYINSLVIDLSATSEQLLASIKTVAEAINEISKASNEGADGTASISQKIMRIKERAGEVNTQAVYVKQSADNLSCLMGRFTL